MTVKEFYDKIGGSYEDAMNQLASESRILKYLGMFLDDDSFPTFKKGMESGDMQLAFRGIHTLKSVSASIGLLRLKELSFSITEDLRDGKDIASAKKKYPDALVAYDIVIKEFKSLLG